MLSRKSSQQSYSHFLGKTTKQKQNKKKTNKINTSYLQRKGRSLNIVKEKYWVGKHKLVLIIIPWDAWLRHGSKKANCRYELMFSLSFLKM